MKSTADTIIAAIILVFSLVAPVTAGPFEDATAAYDRRDYATALLQFRSLAGQGLRPAQSILGIMYEQGQGVPQNYAEAVRWFRLAADQGDSVAQLGLGVMYSKGQGVPQNDAEAAKWYRLASDQGIAMAQYNLGVMYYEGRGVPQDFLYAHMWFNLAAAQGYKDAPEKRNLAAQRMTPSQVTEAQRLAREWRPKLIANIAKQGAAKGAQQVPRNAPQEETTSRYALPKTPEVGTSSLQAQTKNLSPDEVAMVVGTMIVANEQCGLTGNEFPVNVAIAKLGQDVVDFMPNNRFAPLVEVKVKKAREFISGMGKPSACKGMRGVLLTFLPDIYGEGR